MEINKGIIYVIIFMILLSFSGCNYEMSQRKDKSLSNYEIGFNIGQELRKIEDDNSLDYHVIRVNDTYINGDSVETTKVYAKYYKQSFKEQFYKIIQNEVLRQQAVELGIEPSMDEIEADVKWKIEILQSEQNDVSEYVNGCLVGSGMTMEEYADKQIEEAYLSKQREELWRVIIANEREKIEKEAVERKVSVQEAEKEYFEKYVENLVSKADIEYLDDNLEQLME